MTTQNITLKITDSNIDVANIQALLASQGISVNFEVSSSVEKIKKYGKLQIIDKNTAYCLGCESNFDLSLIDDDEKLDFARKNGLCPHCMAKVLEARAIMKKVKMHFETEQVIKNEKSAKAIVLEMLGSMKLNKGIMDQLTDRDFCKKNMGLTFPLFKIYDANTDLDEQRKANGYIKYGKQIYKINRKSYLMSNDLYHRNIEQIRNTFVALNII